MIYFGQHDFGKVDVVPGLFAVQTRFFHVSFFPLIPLSSYLIVQPGEILTISDEVAIPISGKSVAFAYLRALLILAIATAAITLVLILIDASGGRGVWGSELLIASGFLVVLSGIYYVTYSFGVASIERAIVLGSRIGLSSHDIEGHFAQCHEF